VNPTEVHSEWTSVESIITMQSDFVFGYTLSLGMSSGLGSLSGLFDLDEVRLTLLPRSPDSAELELLDGEIGSFNKSETLFTNPGDWAAVMIERLGGLGFWGNAQHHSTGGHGFAASQDFLSTFLSGRTAGEALLQAGRNESGLVYLDPLYRPQGVKIYLENGLKPFQPGTTIGPEDLESQTHLKLNAFLGRGETHWRLSACVSKIEDSNHSPECRVIRSGENAIYEYDPKIALQELLIEDRVVQQIKLKLTVFRPGDEAGAISDSAVYQFVPNQQVKTDTIAY
jgi:hypothetical protein